MADNNFFKNLSTQQTDLSLRIFNLALGRVLIRACMGFNEDAKKDMKKVFDSDDDEKKENFIAENMPDFKKLLKEELKKIENDIKNEIEKRI
jgi:exonuclease VII small subunit